MLVLAELSANVNSATRSRSNELKQPTRHQDYWTHQMTGHKGQTFIRLGRELHKSLIQSEFD